ncbi:F0F1 ATP synthase subunit B [Rheinheimera sediminis]|uniref:F0F1 ATP synthase subunit B family protein n=1 Tax=Rheinheimera sp. YQF-1 TaxID=2499626 RepID=UPI000FD89735|nr:F0F1 ATP synthase subunit B [Rheinheimera sp. YQF-1]RVT44900.1 F0F1 ATP synthase subunit B [Rheinheimera sp. YQF-1]
MLIDWFTVLAQTVNFLILVWLLKRYLYQPILDAIDAREQRIASELADAAEKQQLAGQARDDYQQKNSEFEQQRDALLRQATAAAETERQRLLAQVRTAAEDLARKNQLSVKREQHLQSQKLSRLVQTQVMTITRKTLTVLANQALESAIVAVFVKQLGQLQDEAKSSFKQSLFKAKNSALVRSAFALQDTEQSMIQQAVNHCFSAQVQLRFVTSDQSIAGIELSAEGQLIAWTIESCLDALEKHIADRLASSAPVSLTAQETTP